MRTWWLFAAITGGDIYFGEFMRIFDHLYSRYIVG